MTSQARGWGPGWPQGVPASQLVQVNVAGVRYPGGVRREISQLVELLTAESMRRGYVFGIPGNPAHGCWGYSNRPIAGTQTASNHSWGLAVDINAPRNPMRSPLTTDMPAWLPQLWESYGFAWGGRWTRTPDPMHYEYMGTPAQAAAHTARALTELTPPEDDPDMPAPVLIVRDTTTGAMWAGDFIGRRHIRNGAELSALDLYARTAGLQVVVLDYGADPTFLGAVQADQGPAAAAPPVRSAEPDPAALVDPDGPPDGR